MPDLEDRVAALEAALAQLVQPAFMTEVREDTFRNTRGLKSVRLTHLPTGVTVEAETRPEAVAKLGRAIEGYAQRHAAEASGAA